MQYMSHVTLHSIFIFISESRIAPNIYSIKKILLIIIEKEKTYTVTYTVYVTVTV